MNTIPAKLLSLCASILLVLSCNQSNVSVETETDFLSRLDRATILAPDKNFVTPFFQEVDGLTHWAVFQHAPSQIVYKDVWIGDHAALDFSIGINPPAWLNPGDGVRFQISAGLPNETTQVVYSRYINPKENKNEQKWIQERIVLDTIQNTKATIVLETLPGETNEKKDNESDWAMWGNPRLVSDGRLEEYESQKKPNIILVTLDTVRADYLGCYGNEWIKTPAIDHLAKEGVVFERAFTPMSTTLPAHASIFTSLYPYLHGVISNDYHLALALPRLPQILLEMGYKTGASVSVFHLMKEFSGLGRWFDFYSQNKAEFKEGIGTSELTRSAATTTSSAIEWLDQVHNDPFFLWLHYYDAHTPYQAEGEFHKMYYEGDPTSLGHTSMSGFLHHKLWDDSAFTWIEPFRDLEYFKKEYGAEISYIDSQISRLLQNLKRLRVDDNTLIIITADHGENLGDHDIFFDHWTLFESDIRVPLIFWFPKKVPQGVRTAQQASLLDIAPTVLDILDQKEYPLAQHFQGKSVVPAWDGSGCEEAIMSSEGLLFTQVAAWNEQYKLVWELRRRHYHEKSNLYPDRVLIYDLKDDPGEVHPIGSFYWRNTGSAAVVWETTAVIQLNTDEKQLTPVLDRTEERIQGKTLPRPEDLKAWMGEQSEQNYLKPELLENAEFMDLLISLLQRVKDQVNPPSVQSLVQSDWIVSGSAEIDFASQRVDSDVFREQLRSLNYVEEAGESPASPEMPIETPASSLNSSEEVK